MRYLEVADAVRQMIVRGEVGAGGALPSEADLGGRLGASRMTVRRALTVLRDEGLVTSRRGAGWFSADPVRQELGRITTVEAALEAAGARGERHVLEFGFRPAGAGVAEQLGVPPDTEVLRVRRRNLADGTPFAIVTVWTHVEAAWSWSRADVEDATFYELLARAGVVLGRATQEIGAEVADPDDAALLEVEPGRALLIARRVTRDSDDVPVVASEHRYPAHRTTFQIEFASVGPVALARGAPRRAAARA